MQNQRNVTGKYTHKNQEVKIVSFQSSPKGTLFLKMEDVHGTKFDAICSRYSQENLDQINETLGSLVMRRLATENNGTVWLHTGV